MQTVNFQCGHCGKLMAVGNAHLGQQVRCPHCQQIVIAPPSASNPTPPSESEAASGLVETILHAPPPIADAEDIFAPPDASEDLFGRSEVPRIEIPPETTSPTLPSAAAAALPESPPESVLPSTALFPPMTASAAPPANGESTAAVPAGGEAPWLGNAPTETFAAAAAGARAALQLDSAAETVPAPVTPRSERRKEPGTPWFMILVFSPLLLYAIVITIFAVFLYRHEQDLERQRHLPFELMPDDGDNPGVQKGKKTTRIYRYNPKWATQPLPASLCTTLEPGGKSPPLRIGDLEITPLRVERKRVRVLTENFTTRPELQPADSLVLHLKMKNLSSEYAFAPLDNYFDRRWDGKDQLPPLTQLEVGSAYRFYGGPAEWRPSGDRKDLRQWIEGRKGFEPELLQPGEEKEFFVCTNGGDARGVRILFGEVEGEQVRRPYHGELLWRIRVRRGLVHINDKQYSATAVVGVRFSDKAIP